MTEFFTARSAPQWLARSTLLAPSRLVRSPKPTRLQSAKPTALKRDGLLDGIRGVSLAGVVIGHWLVGGLQFIRSDAGTPVLRSASPLAVLPWAAPGTWLVAVLGLFFLVGGRLSADSWGRANARRGGAWGAWIGRRLARLGRPVLVAAIPVALASAVLHFLGVPTTTLMTVGKTMAQPLWFLGIYLLLTAATPVLVHIDRRWGLVAPLTMAVAVALIDFLCWGPLPVTVPGWVGWLALIPGWTFAFQLGIAWARRPFSRGQIHGLLWGGVVTAAVGFGWCRYPLSMVGGAGLANRSNTHPPSLMLVALEATIIGAVLLAEPYLRRHGEVQFALAKRLNRSPVTILTWHQAAALAPALFIAV